VSPLPASPTVIAVSALRFVAYGEARGLSRASLLDVAGLTEPLLSQPEQRLPERRIFELCAHLARTLQEPALPIHVARTFHVEDFHVVGFAVMTSAQLRTALHRGLRYQRLLTDSGHWELVEGDMARLVWRREAYRELGQRLANECAVAELVHMLRQVLATGFTPLEVCFRHPAPPDLTAHREFFGAPLRFSAAEDCIAFEPSLLQRTLRTANPAMAAYFERQAQELLQELAGTERVSSRVRELLVRELAPAGTALPSRGATAAVATSGEVLPVGEVARRLGMSERTLRRRLKEEATTYEHLVDAVRCDFARRYLQRPEFTLTDVAFLLGFSETSAFQRAFKRWTGRTPHRFRQEATGGASP
jgi:AraC-like DNA-binding protein